MVTLKKITSLSDWHTWQAVFLPFCAVLVLLPVGGTLRLPDPEACSVEPVVINVAPPSGHRTGCSPTKVMSFGCKGTCSSGDYNRPKSYNKNCCKATKMQTQIVHLTCDGGKLLHVPIEHPVKCACQRCHSLSGSLEITVLRTLIDDLRHRGGPRKFREDLG